MKADLHCHSHFSDGQHPPQFLLDRAVANNVTHLAITDHDCLLNCSELKIPPGLTLVPGLEISASWRAMEIHIVGLGIDAESKPLQDYVCRQQQLRRDRISAMDKKLSRQNISGLLEYLQSKPCVSWTRSHVAEFLVADGHAKDMQRAFKRFLGPGGSAFVAAQWPEMDEAIAAIQQASGIAVLAHAGRYGLTRSKLEQTHGRLSAQRWRCRRSLLWQHQSGSAEHPDDDGSGAGPVCLSRIRFSFGRTAVDRHW